MLDGVSLDQLRAFVAAAEAGSFSAAGRRLGRAQSAVSDLIGALEGQIGVRLFDRSRRYPVLTAEGTILLADARSVAAGIDGMKARARGMAGGLEAELSMVIDVFFPMAAVTDAAHAFRARFPATPLRLYVEGLGAAYGPVLDGRASVAVAGSLSLMPPSLTAERLFGVAMVIVVARDHALAAHAGVVPAAMLAEHVHLVLTDRTDLSAGRDFGVAAGPVWRLGDLYARHAFLLNGLGWGGMPAHAVARDVDEGRLVVLTVEDMPAEGLILPMAAVYPAARPPGPAGRWMIERLRTPLG